MRPSLQFVLSFDNVGISSLKPQTKELGKYYARLFLKNISF